jgi:hypothetical protein
MSHHDYIESKDIDVLDCSFYAIIMAAMRKADEENLEKLKADFPETWDELYRRYHAPGGILSED